MTADGRGEARTTSLSSLEVHSQGILQKGSPLEMGGAWVRPLWKSDVAQAHDSVQEPRNELNVSFPPPSQSCIINSSPFHTF